MKIAIIGATGNVGTRLTDEALRRGHHVLALARHASSLPQREGVTAHDVDVSDAAALANALRGNDVVISSVRFLQTTAAQITQAVKAAGIKRLLVVGGAGSLYVAPGVQLVDTPNFPDAYRQKHRPAEIFSMRCTVKTNWNGPSCRRQRYLRQANAPENSASARTIY